MSIFLNQSNNFSFVVFFTFSATLVRYSHEDLLPATYCNSCQEVLEATQELFRVGALLDPKNQRLLDKQVAREWAVCKLCGNRMKSLEDFLCHNVRRHGYTTEFRCGLCRKTTVSETQMVAHLLELHPRDHFD